MKERISFCSLTEIKPYLNQFFKDEVIVDRLYNIIYCGHMQGKPIDTAFNDAIDFYAKILLEKTKQYEQK